jgi:hypothetical protein
MVISVWFVVAKAHHAPMLTDKVPMNLDNTIVNLLP